MWGSEKAEHRKVWEALSSSPNLDQPSPARDRLWLVVQDVICTRSQVWVTPLGSTRQVKISSEYAGDELLAAMTWLYAHEHEARCLAPVALFKCLRGVATKGACGSGRAAQSDALHGLTAVEAGQLVRWTDVEDWGGGVTFDDWVKERFDVDDETIRLAKLAPAFEVLLSRLEEARRKGAVDPLVTVSPKRAGGNSRACTRRMLGQLGYSAAGRRVVHRLLAGSPSGWPGLLLLYSFGQEPTPSQRRYAQRLLAFVAADALHQYDPAGSTSLPRRSGSNAG